MVPAQPGQPNEVKPPKVSGQAVVGEKLTATSGTWTGNQPISYTFKWQTCNKAITSCPANGGSGTTYTVKGSDAGKRVRVKVIAKNSVGQTPGLSDPTGVVQESGGSGGSVAVGSLEAGQRLVVESVHFNPNPVTSRNTPIKVTINITDNKGTPVRGALVSMVSTPVVTSSPTPAQTDSTGLVVYTIQPESDFPIKNGYSVQFYVKAFREGDPTLAGVSGRPARPGRDASAVATQEQRRHGPAEPSAGPRRPNERILMNEPAFVSPALAVAGAITFLVGLIRRSRFLGVLGLVLALAGGGLFARRKIDERGQKIDAAENTIRSELDDLDPVARAQVLTDIAREQI